MEDQSPKQPCPNCGFEYPEDFAYCPECGQKNEASVMSFKDMVLDLLSAFFSFDTKAVRSIPKLLFFPGSLTNEYLNGRRAAYLAPFRLYLFVSIVLFLVLPLVVSDQALLGGSDPVNLRPSTGKDSSAIKQFGATFDSIRAGDSELDSVIRGVEEEANWNFSFRRKDQDKSIITISGDTSEQTQWSIAMDLLDEGWTTEEVMDSLFRDNSRMQRVVMRQVIKLQAQKGEGLVAEFLDKTSYTLFVFLPFFAGFLKLLYIRRKRYYIEHLIFSLHFFSFFFMMIILFVLMYKFVVHVPFWIVPVLGVVYLYAAMKTVYQQSIFKTFFKWLVLLFSTTSIFIPVFFVIVLLISLIFY